MKISAEKKVIIFLIIVVLIISAVIPFIKSIPLWVNLIPAALNGFLAIYGILRPNNYVKEFSGTDLVKMEGDNGYFMHIPFNQHYISRTPSVTLYTLIDGKWNQAFSGVEKDDEGNITLGFKNSKDRRYKVIISL